MSEDHAFQQFPSFLEQVDRLASRITFGFCRAKPPHNHGPSPTAIREAVLMSWRFKISDDDWLEATMTRIEGLRPPFDDTPRPHADIDPVYLVRATSIVESIMASIPGQFSREDADAIRTKIMLAIVAAYHTGDTDTEWQAATIALLTPDEEESSNGKD